MPLLQKPGRSVNALPPRPSRILSDTKEQINRRITDETQPSLGECKACPSRIRCMGHGRVQGVVARWY